MIQLYAFQSERITIDDALKFTNIKQDLAINELEVNISEALEIDTWKKLDVMLHKNSFPEVEKVEDDYGWLESVIKVPLLLYELA